MSPRNQFPYPQVENLFFFKGGCFKRKPERISPCEVMTVCERKELKTRDDGWDFLDTFSLFIIFFEGTCKIHPWGSDD